MQKGWGLRLGAALLAGALGLCPGAADANPLGRGTLSLGGGGMIRALEHKGYSYWGPAEVHQGHRVESQVAFQAGLSAPLWEWGGLLASGESGQTMESWDLYVANNPSTFRYSRMIHAAAYSLGVRLYPWGFDSSFANASDGNPDGKLYWPVPTVRHVYSAARSTHTLNQATGAWANLRVLDQEQFVWAMDYRLTLPLHRRASIHLGYQKDTHLQLRFGEMISDYEGQGEALLAGATLWVPLLFDHDGFAERYFPTLGWLGDLQVDLGYQRRYSGTGARPYHKLGVELSTPLNPSLALRLGYEVVLAEALYFADDPDFVTESGNQDLQSLSAGVTFSFGGLGWF